MYRRGLIIKCSAFPYLAASWLRWRISDDFSRVVQPFRNLLKIRLLELFTDKKWRRTYSLDKNISTDTSNENTNTLSHFFCFLLEGRGCLDVKHTPYPPKKYKYVTGWPYIVLCVPIVFKRDIQYPSTRWDLNGTPSFIFNNFVSLLFNLSLFLSYADSQTPPFHSLLSDNFFIGTYT